MNLPLVDDPRFLFFDLEYNPGTHKVREYGWVHAGRREKSRSVEALQPLLEQARFLVGHNVLHHDRPILIRTSGINLDSRCVLDTLLLSTLLFPHSPYHALRKEYLNNAEGPSDPSQDAELARTLLRDCLEQWERQPLWLRTLLVRLLRDTPGFAPFFALVPQFQPVSLATLKFQVFSALQGQICLTGDISKEWSEHPLEWCYLFTLFQVDQPSDFVPFWIRHQYPAIEDLLRRRRMTPCDDPSCSYCTQQLASLPALNRWFGYSSFRRFETDGDQPLQQQVTEAAIRGESLLAVFPTGGGKSITFQLPALLAGTRLAALTVVISPLVSLMKDQVDVLRLRHGIDDAVYWNGTLSPLERRDILERLNAGEKSLLYLSPEALRSNTIFTLLTRRRIERFVLDEAHCFSAWGHDFRMDYLYIADFLRELQQEKHLAAPIPISCFTATARPIVVDSICSYFQSRLGIELRRFVSPEGRNNLSYGLQHCDTSADKEFHLRALLLKHLGPKIIYATTTRKTESIAQSLIAKGVSALTYHGKMDTENRTQVQDAFQSGQTDVVVATTAFGMGVDKDNVGLVVHYEISSTLENYVQEAGRAGRNPNQQAYCEVLYSPEDLDTHFRLLRQASLTPHEIQTVWNVIRRANPKSNRLVISAIEIADRCGWTEQDIHPAELETKVRLSILVLEEQGFLLRRRNQNLVLGTSLGVKSVEEGRRALGEAIEVPGSLEETAFRILRHLVTRLWVLEPETHLDQLMLSLGLEREPTMAALRLLRSRKLVSSLDDISVRLVRSGIRNARSVLRRAYLVQSLLLSHCKNADPEFQIHLNLQDLNAQLQDRYGESNPRHDLAMLRGLLRYWKHRQVAEIHLIAACRQAYTIEFLIPPDQVQSRLEGAWSGIEIALDALLTIPETDQGLTWFSLDGLVQKLYGEAGATDPVNHRKVEMALLFLHSIGALRLDRGLLVFYSALVLEFPEGVRSRRFASSDFAQLAKHYEAKAEAVHTIGRYAELMQSDPKRAQKLVHDYFQLGSEDFRFLWMSGERKTDPISEDRRQAIEGHLDAEQQQVVHSRSKHILVAAGPGSGKTHLLVHKAASLLWMESTRPDSLLILTYTRAACTELRKRLLDLAGDLARPVRVSTFHAFAFSLLGLRGDLASSDKVVDRAAEWLESGEATEIGVPSVLLVDEYQDLSQPEYRLLRAIYDLGEKSPRMICVGDDDQSIFAFRGGNPQYFRQFTQDFEKAHVLHLTTNYRSLSGIVRASSALLPLLQERVKANVQLVPIAQGNSALRWIALNNSHRSLAAYTAADWIAKQSTSWHLQDTAGVLSRHNLDLYRIAAGLQEKQIAHKLLRHSSRERFPLPALREVLHLRTALLEHPQTGRAPFSPDQFRRLVQESRQSLATGSCWDIVECMVEDYLSDEPEPTLFSWDSYIQEILPQDLERNEHARITLCTMHAAKGLQWDHVVIHLGDWRPESDPQQAQQELRLLYVACTRAKRSLTVIGERDNLPEAWMRQFQEESYQKHATIPQQVEVELGMQDVNLGHYKKDDDYANSLQSILAEVPGGTLWNRAEKNPKALVHGKLYSAWYANDFWNGPMTILAHDGFVPADARLQQVCRWRDPESGREVWVPLLRLRLVRKNP